MKNATKKTTKTTAKKPAAKKLDGSVALSRTRLVESRKETTAAAPEKAKPVTPAIAKKARTRPGREDRRGASCARREEDLEGRHADRAHQPQGRRDRQRAPERRRMAGAQRTRIPERGSREEAGTESRQREERSGRAGLQHRVSGAAQGTYDDDDDNQNHPQSRSSTSYARVPRSSSCPTPTWGTPP